MSFAACNRANRNRIQLQILVIVALGGAAVVYAQDLPAAPQPESTTQSAQPLSMPDLRGSQEHGIPDTQAGVMPDVPPSHAGHRGPGPDGHVPQGFGMNPNNGQTFNWSRFLTSATQTGYRFAAPKGGGGGISDGPVFGGSSARNFAGTGSFAGGMSDGGMQGGGMSGGGGMRGGGGGGSLSAFNLGSGLLHSMAAASGGSLGSSLNFLSKMSDLPSRGLNTSLKGSGMSLDLSGGVTGLFGEAGSMGGGGGMSGGGGSGGNMFSTSGPGTMSGGAGISGGGGMGGGGMGGGGHPGGGMGGPDGGHGSGGGKGPGATLSLKLKF